MTRKRPYYVPTMQEYRYEASHALLAASGLNASLDETEALPDLTPFEGAFSAPDLDPVHMLFQ